MNKNIILMLNFVYFKNKIIFYKFKILFLIKLSGSEVESGHYTSFCKYDTFNEWVSFNDSRIKGFVDIYIYIYNLEFSLYITLSNKFIIMNIKNFPVFFF